MAEETATTATKPVMTSTFPLGQGQQDQGQPEQQSAPSPVVAVTMYCSRCGGVQDFLTLKPQKQTPNCARCHRSMKPITEALNDSDLRQPH